MSIKINYLNKLSNKPLGNVVLFADEKFNIDSLKNTFQTQNFLTYLIY